jgi:hypothetical protein
MKRYTVALASAVFTLSVFCACLFSACTKEGCYSELVKDKHKNDVCPAACPGVKGCDGKDYCNACIAYKNGVSYIR